MVDVGWQTVVAGALLLLAVGLLLYRWNETDRRERLGGGLLLAGVAIDVLGEELFALFRVGEESATADVVWLGSIALVLAGAGLVLSSPRGDR